MKDSRREATRWFLQARDDFRFVQWIRGEGLFPDKGCFVAQQAGEKALKACLYATGERHVLTHSLYEMVASLRKRDESFGSVIDAAKRLDRFYIPTRYPNGLPGGVPYQVYTARDLEEACQDLQKVMEIADKYLCRKEVSTCE